MGRESSMVQRPLLLLSYSWYTYRALYTWLTPGAYITLKLLNPIAQVLFFTLLGIFSGGDPGYYVIGNATQLAVTSGIIGVMQVVVTERRMGTLSSLMLAPTSTALTFYARGIFLMLDGLTSIAAGLIVGVLLFGLNVSQVDWGWLILSLLAICFAVSGLGLTLGCFSLVGTDVNLVVNLALYVLLVLCGANFPVQALPQPLQILASLLPITHGLQAVRSSFAHAGASASGNIGLEALIGCGYMLLGYVLFTYIEREARRRGSFDLQ